LVRRRRTPSSLRRLRRVSSPILGATLTLRRCSRRLVTDQRVKGHPSSLGGERAILTMSECQGSFIFPRPGPFIFPTPGSPASVLKCGLFPPFCQGHFCCLLYGRI
jgi:hypothetical protein